MKIKKIIFGGLFVSLLSNSFALDVILDEKSVEVPLPVGKEIIVKFPKVVTHAESLNSDKTTPEKLTQFLRPDGVLMLEANDSFGKARIIASMVDGNVVVLDLKAAIGAINHETINLIDPTTLKPGTTVQPVRTVTPQEDNPNKPAFLKDGAAKTKSTAVDSSAENTIGLNEMVQFGFRHYAGPARLIGNLKANKIKVTTKGVSRLVRVWGSQLAIKPLSQWRLRDKYLTVMLVNNRSSKVVAFDPRALRGRFVFAAALYPVIQPQGSLNDQTLWAVITEVPFNKAIR